MAETTPLKRHREETLADEETTKRQKPSSSYNDQILCLVDDSDELKQPNNDLTSFITSLQKEISTDDQNAVVSGTSNVEDSSTNSCVSWREEEIDDGNKEKVMQHLLEASDDELGIPNTEFGGSNYEMIKSDINQDYVYRDSLLDGFCDAFWELEDEAANYYTLLQSELFL